ncbi:MAG: hypothetical protein NVSMB9_10590 [Isosphaeraceae bacterium]
MSRRLLLLGLFFSIAMGLRLTSTRTHAQQSGDKSRKVVKTDQEWSRLLTPEQYMVTRQKATEPAFSGQYATSHGQGTYACVCCDAPLFSSRTKFDSGTGWPSFWRPIDPKRIESAPDYHEAEPRIEVMCKDCGAHLGHVFEDGPPPTGLRFCINSTALKLVSRTSAARGKGMTKKSRVSADKGKGKSTDKSKGGSREPSPPAPKEPTVVPPPPGPNTTGPNKPAERN